MGSSLGLQLMGSSLGLQHGVQSRAATHGVQSRAVVESSEAEGWKMAGSVLVGRFMNHPAYEAQEKEEVPRSFHVFRQRVTLSSSGARVRGTVAGQSGIELSLEMRQMARWPGP